MSTEQPNLSEPMSAEDAYRLAAEHEGDPDAIVFLIPTLPDLLGEDSREGAAKALNGMRIMFESFAAGMEKAIVLDTSTGTATTEHFRNAAISIEDTLTSAYGSHPDLLARLLTQHVIDTVLDDLADQTPGETMTPEDGQAERARVLQVLAPYAVTSAQFDAEQVTDDIMAALGEGD